MGNVYRVTFWLPDYTILKTEDIPTDQVNRDLVELWARSELRYRQHFYGWSTDAYYTYSLEM